MSTACSALIRSFSAIDAASFPGYVPLDVMMHPCSVQSPDGLAAWRKQIRIHFANNGTAIRFNIFNAETLKAARKVRFPPQIQDNLHKGKKST